MVKTEDLLPECFAPTALIDESGCYNYEPLLEQISAQALEAEAILGQTDEHGQRYRVDLEITGTEGQQEIVRTGWIVEPGSDAARLVTLFVRRRR
ncbi:DUF6883 domain-containing protein [Argonema galeatum]|uniref:DUF6883 domain-containing protein n=1 Tax=Argonema galeatum TaxID=2942762 RepID=UPI0020135BB1|nr:DUF6883 domain-containing protein [Argonema galeatum]MCL1468925.1 hypothetical protein [Argonema galeatum A003/A1]